jgi:DNA-binding HxlR family transcriptional regulator
MVSNKPTAEHRSTCPIANSLDVIGDRWTLVIIRDLMFSSRSRYGELLNGPEGITTNILADRLKRLERASVVQKRAYQQRPKRYEYSLTATGMDLYDVLCALIRWGGQHVVGSSIMSDEQLAAMDPRERRPPP